MVEARLILFVARSNRRKQALVVNLLRELGVPYW